MRIIAITKGYSDFVIGDVVETKRRSLSGADIKLALVDATLDVDDATFPTASATVWRTPDLPVNLSGPNDSQAEVFHFADSSRYAVGDFYLWALPVDNPTKTPVKASNHLIRLV